MGLGGAVAGCFGDDFRDGGIEVRDVATGNHPTADMHVCVVKYAVRLVRVSRDFDIDGHAAIAGESLVKCVDRRLRRERCRFGFAGKPPVVMLGLGVQFRVVIFAEGGGCEGAAGLIRIIEVDGRDVGK